MTTDTDPSAAQPTAKAWRLDTDNGSMAPRSALDVLVDLNERVTTGHLAEYQQPGHVDAKLIGDVAAWIHAQADR